MIKYIHGSEDSTDVDVFYIFDSLPSKNECKIFCSENPAENRNIIVVKDGVVTDVYKGTPDEVNNSLIDTYDLHPQEYALCINRRLERDFTIKAVRAVRSVLSCISRTQYRSEVKFALISDFETRLRTLESIDFSTIDFNGLRHTMSREDLLKTIAFQIGQTMALAEGVELYTKSSIAEKYPALRQFLYRDKSSSVDVLNDQKNKFICVLREKLQYSGFSVTDGKTVYNCKTEERENN